MSTFLRTFLASALAAGLLLLLRLLLLLTLLLLLLLLMLPLPRLLLLRLPSFLVDCISRGALSVASADAVAVLSTGPLTSLVSYISLNSHLSPIGFSLWLGYAY